ncbi:MAG: DUF4394 domain-containing protein, partial [Ramlibacter sp.]|nr:DUF4394 domain-containing protein [Ramlibacter sp.]
MNFRQTALSLAVATAALGLVGCGTGSDDDAKPTQAPVSVGDTVALTASGRLISFNRATPGTPVGSIAISGLTGKTLVVIDGRPADGKLYGLTSDGNVFLLDPATGVASLKVTLKAAAGDDNPYAGLTGTRFGIDFNPVVDRLRVVSDTGQNLRINVDTGDTTTDGAIASASTVTAAAYTNSFAGSTSTQLFDLDLKEGRLQLQNPPNDGVLSAGVALGVTADASNGFDIDSRTNTGFAVLRVAGETALYSINLSATANAATMVGVIADGGEIVGVALATAAAAPTAIGLTSDNRLVAFNPQAPNALTSSTAITGLAAGESIVGVDFRPRDGMLYGVSSAGKLYTINPASGAATLRASLMADPADTTAQFTGLAGGAISVDFNPAADRLRIVSSTGQNLRVVVETVTTAGVTVTAGNTTTDTQINRASGAALVLASAYSNNFAGTTSTTLFNLEQNTDQLTQQIPPDD